MMYDEFIKGTNCKMNDHNYKVFRNLEAMYMNSDMTKAEIYEYGKKLVDNSKSEEENKIEEIINAHIKYCLNEIIRYKGYIEDDKRQLEYWKSENDKEMIKAYKNSISFYKREIKNLKTQITGYEWVIAKTPNPAV